MWEPSGGEDFLVCVREDKTELNAHVHFCTIYIHMDVSRNDQRLPASKPLLCVR